MPGPAYQYETVTVTVLDGHVAHVEMNRPKHGNAFNTQLWDDYRRAFEDIAADANVRAVVLTGAGKFFTVGLDIKDPKQAATLMGDGGVAPDPARKAYQIRNLILKLQDTFTAMERCPQPVIACGHSAIIGAGVDLMCAADVRFCAKDAWFSIKEVDIGMAADVGTLQRIQHCIGNASLVRELAYTARRMESAEALSCGFVSRVFGTREDMFAGALATARLIASKSPVAVAGTKHQLLYARGRPVEEGLHHMAVWNAGFLQTEDMGKAALASISKQDMPAFSKL